MTTYTWYPQKIFNPSLTSDTPYTLLILNQPLSSTFSDKIAELWNGASYRVTVDGGTNQWFDFLRRHPEKVSNPNPDLICGDFDSIELKVLNHFRENSEVIETHDQDYTDFSKALNEIRLRKAENNFILTLCEHSGRLDQIFANIETLFHANRLECSKPIYLVTPTSLAWLLRPGRHEIVFECLPNSKGYCGLIPIGEKSPSVSSTGLKWNLENQTLAFGQLVSTSNALVDQNVQIQTSNTILFYIDDFMKKI